MFVSGKKKKGEEEKKKDGHSSHSTTQACTPIPNFEPQNKTIFLQTGYLKAGWRDPTPKLRGNKVASPRGAEQSPGEPWKPRGPAGAGAARGARRAAPPGGEAGCGWPREGPAPPPGARLAARGGPGPGTGGRAPPSARAPVSWLAQRVPCYLLGRS